MGVDYRAVIGIGKEFGYEYEVVDFLESNNFLDDQDREAIDEDGIEEWACSSGKIEVECLNAYSGNYYFVGYEVSCYDPEAFQLSFEQGIADWKKYFPDEEPSIIKTVKVY